MTGRSKSAYMIHLLQLLINNWTRFTYRFIGPATDYGSSMVQWMRNRRPRYKGGVMLEAERPSPSYIVDVGDQYNDTIFWPCFAVSDPCDSLLDASPCCKTQCCRYCTSKASSLISEQNQTPYQHCTMDTRRSAVFDRLKQWRIHTVERHRV